MKPFKFATASNEGIKQWVFIDTNMNKTQHRLVNRLDEFTSKVSFYYCFSSQRVIITIIASPANMLSKLAEHDF